MENKETRTRLDETIGDVAYIYDCLRTLREIQSSGDCNVCARQNECQYVPEPGQMVRYNCFYFEGEDGEKE